MAELEKTTPYGLTPKQLSKYFNLAFSITIETKLTMFKHKTLHETVFTKNKQFKAKLACSDLCYLCSKPKQDLRHTLVSRPGVSGPIYMVSGTRDNPPPELPWPR